MNLDHMTVDQLRWTIETVADLAERYQSTANHHDNQLAFTGNRETQIRADVWSVAAEDLRNLLDNCTTNCDWQAPR